ncbi:MAG: MBL fold metallo-hydrolase [Actinobacteria bacterium]|nr:MBL fold metallo-hydrolase [Actinomycetota bacterium]
MQLVVLGSGTCAPTLKRSTACYYVQMSGQHILLDVGFGSIRRTLQAGIDYREIDFIIITHIHLDHVGDLAPLVMALRYTPGLKRQKPLTLVGPPGFKNYLNSFSALAAKWFFKQDGFNVNVREADRETLRFTDWDLTAMPMLHSDSANGYRIKSKDRVLAYSGDTGMCDQVISLVSHADLAILECSAPDEEPLDGHLTPFLAGRIAERGDCRKVLLSHFYPMMENIDVVGKARKYFHGEIEAAEDLKQYII